MTKASRSAHADFALTPAQVERLQPRAMTTTFVVTAALLTLDWSAALLTVPRDLDRHGWTLVALRSAGLLLMLAGGAFCFGVWRVSQIPTAGSVAIGPDGMSGSLDGRPFALPWSQVASVTDDGDTFVFARRGFIGPQFHFQRIAVPKLALERPDLVWSMLEELLVAKRGLVRHPGQQSLIVNTAQ